MTCKKLLALIALACAGTSVAGAAVNHNLYLGFRTAELGDQDLIINLGLFSTIQEGGLSLNINSQLANLFGSEWNTRNDLSFGMAGANISGTRVVYASNFTDPNGFERNAGNTGGNLSAGALSTLANQIAALKPNEGGAIDDSNQDSWTGRALTTGGVFGNNILSRSEFETTTDFTSIASKNFDVWSYTQGTSSFANTGMTLSLDNLGNVTSVSAIPEPSTYGLMGAGALGAAALIRRRRRKA